MLVDPNTLSADVTVAVTSLGVTEDGTRLAYSSGSVKSNPGGMSGTATAASGCLASRKTETCSNSPGGCKSGG